MDSAAAVDDGSVDGGGGFGGDAGGGSGGDGGPGAGAGGESGSAGSPADPCDSVACQQHASCSVVAGEARCQCNPPYEPTGQSCTLPEPPPACMDVECPAGQTCIEDAVCVPVCALDDSCELGGACAEAEDCESGVCVSEVCRPACGPDCANTEPCVKAADCASGYCARDDGDDLIGSCRPACARAGCDTAEECTRAADCSGGVCNGGRCQPACGTACQPGDECATSNNCTGSDICDEIGHVCLTSCTDAAGDYTFETIADFDDARYCWQIDDDVMVLANVPAITADHLPYLRDVTGTLNIGYGDFTEITLPRLETIGSLSTGNSLCQRFDFPELRMVGSFAGANGGFNVGLSVATEIHAPKLEQIYGPFTIQSAPNLTTVRLDSLEHIQGSLIISAASMITTLDLGVLDMRFDVNGSITLNGLPKIPWTTFTAFILPLNGNETVTSVGCDTASPCNCGDTSCVPPP